MFNRVGRQSEKRLAKDPQKPAMLKEDCCFSVIYGELNKSLDLVANDHQTAATWVTGLKSLIAIVRSVEKKRSGHQ